MWTLIGMGATAVITFILLLLAYIAQSPRLMKRLGLAGNRLDLRARTFTGYALASLLLAFGFFLAGVPLEGRNTAAEPIAEINVSPADTPDTLGAVNPITATAVSQDNPAAITNTVSTPTNNSGAMSGLAVATPTDSGAANTLADETGVEIDESAESSTAPAAEEDISPPDQAPEATPTATPTNAPTATPTPTPTATATPTPTLTPTRIIEETAVLNIGTSTVWLRRTPGSNQNLVILNGGDIVILRPGHANMGGVLWREVTTVGNETGWIEEKYLDFGAAAS